MQTSSFILKVKAAEIVPSGFSVTFFLEVSLTDILVSPPPTQINITWDSQCDFLELWQLGMISQLQTA